MIDDQIQAIPEVPNDIKESKAAHKGRERDQI
jgi:hypothetical protein